MCQLTLLPNVDPLRSQSRSSLSIVKYHVFIKMPLNHVFIEMPLNHVFRLIICHRNAEFKSFFRGAAQHFKMYANTEIFNNGYEKNVI